MPLQSLSSPIVMNCVVKVWRDFLRQKATKRFFFSRHITQSYPSQVRKKEFGLKRRCKKKREKEAFSQGRKIGRGRNVFFARKRWVHKNGLRWENEHPLFNTISSHSQGRHQENLKMDLCLDVYERLWTFSRHTIFFNSKFVNFYSFFDMRLMRAIIVFIWYIMGGLYLLIASVEFLNSNPMSIISNFFNIIDIWAFHQGLKFELIYGDNHNWILVVKSKSSGLLFMNLWHFPLPFFPLYT